MISTSRVLAVVQKDFAWAKSNLKILGIMILPLLVVLLFSRVDSEGTFLFSLAFVNSFVGIFSTSYLIIEEKRKGTLLALLTSPLSGGELLLGKFLFNLIICGFFSLIVILLNSRFDLLINPFFLVNLVFFAGATCFIGFVVGVFFKNEQEMSVFAPLLMVFFCFGDTIGKTVNRDVRRFFPDYFLAQSAKDFSVSLTELIRSSGFSFTLFFICFLLATSYTKFYFSNNREKRFSIKLPLYAGLLALFLATSGFINKNLENVLSEGEGKRVTLAVGTLTVDFDYLQEFFEHRKLVESPTKAMDVLTLKDKTSFNLVFTIREIQDDEVTYEKRLAKIVKDSERTLISHQKSPKESHLNYFQWVYIKGNRMVILREIYCGKQMLQFSLNLALNKASLLEKHFPSFEDQFKRITVLCQPDNS